MVDFKPRWENILVTVILLAAFSLLPLIPLLVQPLCIRAPCPPRYYNVNLYTLFVNSYAGHQATYLTFIVLLAEIAVAYVLSCILVDRFDPNHSKR